MQELPKIVLDRLREDRLRLDGVAEAHPEADLLTAFVEHSLADAERARVLEHLARCTDCREIVTLALPATDAVAITTSSAPVRNRWFNWPALRWGVVAAGIIAVASIGMVQYRQRTLKSETLAPTLTARNETVTTAQRFQPSPGSFEHQTILPQITGRQVQVRKKASPNPQNKLSDGESVGSVSAVPKSYPMPGGALPGRAVGGPIGGVAGSGFAPAKGVTAASAARTSPPRTGPQFAVPPSSQVVDDQNADAATVATAQSRISDQLIQNQKELRSQNRPAAKSDVVKAKAPTSLEATPGGASAHTLEPSIISSLETSSAVVSASPSWTISSSGVLRRSFDAGNTWEDVNVNSVAEASASKGNLAGADEKAKVNEKKVRKEIAQPSMVFRAVTALDSEVWAGGSGAVLYHSTDSGAHWVRVLPSLASTVLTGDITVIEFSDPQHGRIATSYGEVWITADNGQTWSLQP
ncbi:MAG TPA: YCF48-related protein [Candidatus Eremiobacteraceae bacterium]|nr:YCF48-related protein [Candidatus Eremiobacteraceae bacterium]